jgi:hypothetical protein
MSIRQPQCRKCQVPSQCEVVRPLQQGQENAFAVVWKCPRCGDRNLVVSPTGPLIVKPGMCLQCGHEGHAEDQACPECSASLDEVLPVAERSASDEALLQAARDDFALGTCRRGLTLVNFVLARNPRNGEAWSIKGQFLQHLGFAVALKITMQEAVRQTQRNG